MLTEARTGSSVQQNAERATAEAIEQARRGLTRPADLALLFVSPRLDFTQVMGIAHNLLPSTRLAGCSTAGEITERGLTHGGVAVMLISGYEMRFNVTGAHTVTKSPALAAATLCEGFAEDRARALRDGLTSSTSILLVDGVNGQGEVLIDEVLRATGTLHEIVGGAAGDEGAFKATQVGSDQRASIDAAACVRVFSKHRMGIGVDHGLTPATEPMRVTRSTGSVLHELDGRPAFEAYERLALARKVDLKAENVSKFLINNELGVLIFDELRKARAPLKVGENGSLICAAAVPQGSSVSILGGDKKALIRAAGSAAEEAKRNLRGRKAAGVLLFDCICRETILEESFGKEIDAVREVFPNTPLAGFLTYGEIARYTGRLDGWHNATAVVAAIPE